MPSWNAASQALRRSGRRAPGLQAVPATWRQAARALSLAIGPWLPARCALCALPLAGSAAGLCAGCLAALPGAGAPRCDRCAVRDPGPDGLCDACVAGTPVFDHSRTLADYRAPLDRAIVAMKFHRRRDLAIGLGNALGQALAIQRLPQRPTRVVAVPLSLERQLERGFNPAQVIAARVSRLLDLPAPRPVLRRLWHTGSQSGLDLQARRDNVEGAFDCDRSAVGELGGQVVVLVDDVMTTGATLQAAADTLKCAGARVVINAVVARTPQHRIVA